MYSKKEITDDVRKWSEHFLEVPNKHLGGFPACPFAKKTWQDNKVVVEIKRKYKQYKAELNAHIKQLNFSVHEILIFCDPYFNYSLDEFQNIIDAYNNWYNKSSIIISRGGEERVTGTIDTSSDIRRCQNILFDAKCCFRAF